MDLVPVKKLQHIISQLQNLIRKTNQNDLIAKLGQILHSSFYQEAKLLSITPGGTLIKRKIFEFFPKTVLPVPVYYLINTL